MGVLAALAGRANAQTPVVNPDFTAQCGTKVILVLDESGSITGSDTSLRRVRTAAKAFVAGLADTGSQVAVVEFNTTARRAFNYTTVTSGTTLTNLNRYIDGQTNSGSVGGARYGDAGGFTNWQDAMQEVRDLNTSGGVAPLVVFITDGDPTAYNSGGGTTTGGNGTGLSQAITAANEVKTQGSHILAVGVGAALDNTTSRTRLTQISGPDVALSTAAFNISTTDVLAVDDFSNLAAALRAIVTQLCQSSVTVTKQVDDGAGYVNAGAGWQFTGGVASGDLESWIQPTGTGTGPRSASTDATSTATFQWKPSGVSSSITLTETQKPGYDLDSITCTKGENTPVTIHQNDLQWSLTVGQTDVVKCTVRNKKQGKLVVDKVTDPAGDATSFEFDPSWSPTNFSLTDAATPRSTDLPAGGAYSVTELAKAGWDLTGASCTLQGGGTTGTRSGSTITAITVQTGKTTICTFTNTKRATVIVKKVMVGGTGEFSFTGTPAGTIDTDNGTITASVAPGRYTSVEGAAPGWDLTELSCDDANSTGSIADRTATFNA